LGGDITLCRPCIQLMATYPVVGHPLGASSSNSAFVEVETDSSARHCPAKKNAWTSEEDAMLTRIVAHEGAGHWTKVAGFLPGRMGRQCRERWFNHLAPNVKKGDWTAEEDKKIIEAVRDHGTKWSTIQKLLPGRSDNSIKNRYYSAIRKVQRMERRGNLGTGGMMPMSPPEAMPAEMGASPTELCVTEPQTQIVTAIPTTAIHNAIHTAAIGVTMRHTMCADSPTGSPQASPEGKRKRVECTEQQLASKAEAPSYAAMMKREQGLSAPLTVVTAEALGPAEVDPAAPTYAVSSVISLSPADMAQGFRQAAMEAPPTANESPQGSTIPSTSTVNQVQPSEDEMVLPAAHAVVSGVWA